MPRLYLDCDGVLADFITPCTAILGMDPALFESLHGADEMWRRVRETRDFFAELPLLPDALTLFHGVSVYRPVILTGVPRGGWAEIQKIQWISKHFPSTPFAMCFARDKYRYCYPGDVLIDDRPKYKGEWEKEGGTFILHKNAELSLRELRFRTGFK